MIHTIIVSSLCIRPRASVPKVVGSNPTPATMILKAQTEMSMPFFLGNNYDTFDCTDRGAIYMEPKGPNSLKARAKNLVNLIDYQEGSVVSRTLIDKTVGTLTLFAFDEGQGLSEHTAPFDAFVYIIDGEAEVLISNKAYSVGTGQMIIMPANEPHSLKAPEKFKMMLVMIRA